MLYHTSKGVPSLAKAVEENTPPAGPVGPPPWLTLPTLPVALPVLAIDMQRQQ
jgi:hypothetical protein